MAGSVVAAMVTYGFGYYLGRPAVERLSGGSIGRLNERLARRGILTVVAVRMIPGIAAMAVFAEGILALVRDADLKHFLVAALALVFILGMTLLARRLFFQWNDRRQGD
jgi:membrane protein DedA with SNARE-associated domain